MSRYLDTRDLDEELDELESMADDSDGQPHRELCEDERERLTALRALRDDIGSEWTHGVTLIAESDFEDYARELADDCYNIDASPLGAYIDWSRWADAVQTDYTVVEFDGETYYYRS